MPRFSLRRLAPVMLIAAFAGLAACSTPDDPATFIHDPYEPRNREVHALNKSLDRAFVRPVGRAYSGALPDDVETVVANVATTWGLPGQVVNNLLQGDVPTAGANTLRFVINTTAGFGGLFDPATEAGLPQDETDFGATLHVWGVPEGAYLETPLLGPSTERDTAGRIVDALIDPVGEILPRHDRRALTGVRIAEELGDRGRFSDTVDSVLYDSADSYAQSRLLYLQNRRFELGDTGSTGYDDPYADPYDDPYFDPYEDQ